MDDPGPALRCLGGSARRVRNGHIDVSGFVPPPYPYDRLDRFEAARRRARRRPVDLSIGTPFDPPPAAVIEALSSSGTERSYPPSIGTLPFREAARAGSGGASMSRSRPHRSPRRSGRKSSSATLPQWMQLRTPSRDTVLYPAISYPSYEMGATLAGCRAVPVRLDARRAHRSRLDRSRRRRAGRCCCG